MLIEIPQLIIHPHALRCYSEDLSRVITRLLSAS